IGVSAGLALAQQLSHVALANVAGTINRLFLPSDLPEPVMTPRIAPAGARAGTGPTLAASYRTARPTNRVNPAEALRSSRASAMLGGVRTFRLAGFGVLIAGAALLPMSWGGETNGYIACAVVMTGLTLLVPLAVKGLRWASVRMV